MQYINESYHPDWQPFWQPNNTAGKCSNPNCESTFGLLLRKHHCRQCGKIYCKNCFGEELYVNIYKKNVPLCIYCHENIKQLGGNQ